MTDNKIIIKVKINKDDDLPIVAERVFSAVADEVVLVVPKFSKFSQSLENLRFIKQGLAGTSKELVIESVDDQVVKLAAKAKIKATNPFFAKPPLAEPVSVAAPPAETDEPAELVEENQPPLSPPAEEEEKAAGGEQIKASGDVFQEIEQEIDRSFRPSGIRPSEAVHQVRGRLIKPSLVSFGRGWQAAGISLVLIVAAAWLGLKVLPQAEINITTQKSPWDFHNQVVVDKNVSTADLKDLRVPGQVFSQKRNTQLFFPASSRKVVERKAKGTITIYNAFDSSPQPLVASTRFQTDDGKIFRIDEAVTVPGARVVDNRIVPSIVDVPITADKPGEEYNVGPAKKLTIPGFKRSPPKFAGFFGEIKTSLTGGYRGELAYPTEADIKAGKDKAVKVLKESLEVLIDSQIPRDFAVLDGAAELRIITERAETTVNEKGEFPVFVEGEIAVIGFRERDLIAALSAKAQEKLGGDFLLKSHDLKYQLAQADFSKKQLTLAVDFTGIMEKPVDVGDLRRRIVGKSETDLKALVFSLPGLKTARVSLWPFWVSQVPDDQGKIAITVD